MDMERATVNVATGALGPVLQKLTALLVQEQYSSLLGHGTHSDIEFIKSKLASQHSLLLKIWEREDLGAECNKWMIDARELSYDMEDDIDDFMGFLESRYSGYGHQISNFKSLLQRVKDISTRLRGEWKIAAAQDISSHRSKQIEDPRARFRHRDASDLVGMDEPKEKLLKLLQDNEMVCIHGFAGIGKTTLTDLVYHEIGHEFECRAFVSLSKSPDMLEVLRAVLSQVTDGVQSSGSSSTAAATEENLSIEISNFLSDKRYLVILDDIWHWQDWEIIRNALPEGVPRCRILATTRTNVIAEKCRLTKFNIDDACIYRYGGINDQDAATLSRRVFNKEVLSKHHKKEDPIRYKAQIAFVKKVLPNKIAEMCCGMPLSVECLSSAVASIIEVDWYDVIQTKEILDIMENYSIEKAVQLERFLWRVLLDGLLSSGNNHYPSLKPLATSLRFGYDDLPLHLKTCLLYCSMYPTGYKIERHGLVRKWMAEGFVCQHEGAEEEAAESCLDELVSMGLLQPESSEEIDKKYYSVHPMMRAFLICKSEQAAFAAYHEEDSRPSILDDPGRIRRLSVGILGRPDDIVSVIDGALHTRSLVVFSYAWRHYGGCLVRWEKLENVRVLSIECSGFPLSDIDLADICSRLLRLRYLGLKAMPISGLPPQIGRLQSLETLDLSDSKLSEVPKEIQELCGLQTLDLSNTSVRELPREIGLLQCIQTLDASNTSVTELPKEIGKLQQLERLNVSHTSVTELPREIGELHHLKTLNVSHNRVRELPSETGKLQRLETLDTSNTDVGELPREIGELHHLKTLNVSHTRVSELPREIGKLQRLETLDVTHSRVRELPREIGKLQHMKTLNVSHTNVRELPWLLTSFSVLAGNKYPAKAGKLSNNDLDVMRHLHEDTILSSLVKAGEDLTIMLYDHSYQLLPVAGLKIVGRHISAPEWVKQHLASVSTLDIRLCKLEDKDLEFMCKKMLNLQHLTLRLEVLPQKALVITGAGFLRLMSFYLDCRLPMVTFQQGAMPKLEHLEFKFYTSKALKSKDPVGIRHLLSLKRVVFQSSPRYKSSAPGISMVINKVREEAKVHPNKITISINGKDEEKTATISDMISVENIFTIGGADGNSGASMIETGLLHVSYDNGSDDEMGSIIPIESYYSFSVDE